MTTQNEYLDFVLDGAGLGAWDWCLKTQKVLFDRRWCEMVGLDVETVRHELSTWDQLCHPDDREKAYQDIKAHLEGKTERYENIHRLRHTNGTWVWILDRGKVSERDSAGNPTRFTGTHLDISHFKKSEILSDNLQKMARIGGWELDLTTQNTFWTGETYRIHGVALGTPTDKISGIEFYTPRDRARVLGFVERCAQGTSFCDTFEIVDTFGNHKRVKSMGEPVFDANGRVTHLRGTFQDITEERNLQISSAKIDRQIHHFFEVSLDLLCIAGMDGMFKKLSPAFTDLLGYSLVELYSKPLTEFIHPDDLDLTNREIKKLSAGQMTVNFKNRYRCKDGNYRVLSWNTSPDPDAGLLYAVARDVTQQELSEQRLQEAQRVAKIGSWSYDLQTHRFEGSEQFYEFLPEDVRNSKDCGITLDCHFGAIHIDDREAVKSAFYRCARDGESYKIRFRIVKSGKILWVEEIGQAQVSADGKVIQMSGTCQDITERVVMEDENRMIIDILNIGIWKFDPVNQSLEWDKGMYRVFEIDEADFTGEYHAWESSLTAESKTMAVQELELALKGEKEFNTTFEIKTKAGKRKYIGGRGVVIRNNEKQPIMMYGLNWDRTHEFEVELALEVEKAKALQSSKMASLGEMSAGVAHEINNPLAIISGNAVIIPRILQDPEKVKSKIETFVKAADRITKIVNGLKKFARVSDKNNRGLFSVSKIVEEAISMTDHKSKRSETPVTASIEGDSKIFCDEIEIEQVLINLINNGIDAVKDLPEKWVKLSVFETDAHVVIQARDSGCGIAPEVSKKLFEPFFTTKAVGQGTGLGLSITKGIIEDHQAEIEILRNDPNTCFEIRFKKNIGAVNVA